jgi:hypothetical protein
MGQPSPAPWTWDHSGYPPREDTPEALALFDADGNEILGTDGDDWAWIVPDSDYVKEVVRAAPEMEALLRRWLEATSPSGLGSIAAARELTFVILARIDAVKDPVS